MAMVSGLIPTSHMADLWHSVDTVPDADIKRDCDGCINIMIYYNLLR